MTRSHDDHTVVSVGPYMFHSSPVRARIASARSAGSASPPLSARSPDAPAQPSSTSIRQVAGVACMTVARTRPSSAARAWGERAVARSAIAVRPPVTSGRNSSSQAMSKPAVVTASSVSCSPRPGSPAMETRKLVRFSWETTTPLGRPVEPDV
ncbi:hypothetical protein GCM10010532_041610 [Dactylosporangium siamense]